MKRVVEIKNSRDVIIYFDIDDTVADLEGFLNSLEVTEEIQKQAGTIFDKYYKNTEVSFERVLRSVLFFKNCDTMYSKIEKLNNVILNQIQKYVENNEANFTIKFLTFIPRDKKIDKFLDIVTIAYDRKIDEVLGTLTAAQCSVDDRFLTKYNFKFILKRGKEYFIKSRLKLNYEVLFASLDDGGKEKYANKNSYLIDNDINNVNKFTKAGGHGILFDRNKDYIVELID